MRFRIKKDNNNFKTKKDTTYSQGGFLAFRDDECNISFKLASHDEFKEKRKEELVIENQYLNDVLYENNEKAKKIRTQGENE